MAARARGRRGRRQGKEFMDAAPAFYPHMALGLVLATTGGQFVGWAAGSALLALGWCRLRQRPLTLGVMQLAMSLVYVGLAAVPLLFYHLLFGPPLAGLPQPELAAWLRQHAPGAYAFLFPGHRLVDLGLIPLGIAVLALIWGSGEGLLRRRGLQALLLTLVLTTSFAVALSLAIHSILAHIRLSP